MTATSQKTSALRALGSLGRRTGSDPCLQHGPLIPIERLLEFIERTFRPVVGTEICPLRQSRGRVLAADLLSCRAVPAFDNTAVDGWAVAAADLAATGHRHLPVDGRIAAGHPLGRPVRPGHAYRIFTGAPVPAGLDTVVMQEDARQQDDGVILPPTPKGANLRYAGEALAAGQRALAAGTRLRAPEIALAASLGMDRLPVRQALRVAVFSTGDEVVAPGAPLCDGAIYDSNRFSVMALLDDLGCRVSDLGILPDQPVRLADLLRDAAGRHDLLISSGGVSVGEEDHVRRVIAALGHIHLWRLALKPGRPLALGSIGNIPILALPGNPVAAIVTFLLFARPLIARLSGALDRPPRRYLVSAGFALQREAGRREFARARLEDAPSGPIAVLFPNDSSGVIASLTASDGLVDLPAGRLSIAKGDPVAFLPFAGLMP
jgi:molybdopterin molybdotransferase